VVRLEEVSGVERRPEFFFGGAVLTLKDGGRERRVTPVA
jgi:hypothetical protein